MLAGFLYEVIRRGGDQAWRAGFDQVGEYNAAPWLTFPRKATVRVVTIPFAQP